MEQVFKKLAAIHCLEVPIEKDPNWLQDFADIRCKNAFKKFPIEEEILKYNCETLKAHDLKDELNFIKNVIERVNSPVVFTHNDYRSLNLMITEPNDELIVCDFDISCYGYRGNDFVYLIRDWRPRDESYKVMEGIPCEDSVLSPLLHIYLKEMQRIVGKDYFENEINSVEHLIREVKVFSLFQILVTCVYTLKMEGNRKEFMVSCLFVTIN